jgi:hypothetical protein
MRATEIEKEVEICDTNITNKTKCTSTHWMFGHYPSFSIFNYNSVSETPFRLRYQVKNHTQLGLIDRASP